MMVLRYSRLGAARFLSHIDVLRQFGRIMRRADIPVAYSQGFNPHALLFFSPPTPVGVGSVAEWAAADVSLPAEEFLERFNSAVSEDMRASEALFCPVNPNLAGRIAAAEYVFPFPADAYDLSRGLMLEYVKKGETVREDAADRIFESGERDGRLRIVAAAGNVTLRPDRVFEALARETGMSASLVDVVKTAQFVREGDSLVEVADFVAGACGRVK